MLTVVSSSAAEDCLEEFFMSRATKAHCSFRLKARISYQMRMNWQFRGVFCEPKSSKGWLFRDVIVESSHGNWCCSQYCFGNEVGKKKEHKSNAQSNKSEVYVKNSRQKKNYVVACKYTIFSEGLQEKKREPHSRSIFTMTYTTFCSTH